MTEDEYREEVKSDIMSYLSDAFVWKRIPKKKRGELYDEMFLADSVTGNGSGSYTFDRAEAEENIKECIELLGEAMEEFGSGHELLEKGAEACDVTIRCHLLGQLIDECIDEHNEKLKKKKEDEEDDW